MPGQRTSGATALAKAITALAQRHEVVVVEHLRTANLSRRKPGAGARGRGLNRAIGDAALAEVRRLLGYKTTWYRSRLVEADPFYPSSKTCSVCGERKPSLALSERKFRCLSCGVVLDRDVNAATNLARLGEHPAVRTRPAGSGPVAGRGADRKTFPGTPGEAGGNEASIPQPARRRRKPGAVASQGTAARDER